MNHLLQDTSRDYELHSIIGQGAYSDVHLAISKRTGRRVALKSIKINSTTVRGNDPSNFPKAVLREIQALKILASNRVVELIDVISSENAKVCLVFEYLPSDLAEIVAQADAKLPSGMIKAYLKMILEAVSYCHSKNIIHRDIKPSNILLSSNGAVKLGDFGLARIIDNNAKDDILSHEIQTRWYRSPEILFASRIYDFKVDIWSVGVIMSELISLMPLFPGGSDIDQMYRVFQIMGTPSLQLWPEVANLPDYSKINFPEMRSLDLSLVIPDISEQELDFMHKMLQLNPSHRFTAAELLLCDYFSSWPHPYGLSELPVPLRKLKVHQPLEKPSFSKIEEILKATEASFNIPT